jgi:hypothetical protein
MALHRRFTNLSARVCAKHSASGSHDEYRFTQMVVRTALDAAMPQRVRSVASLTQSRAQCPLCGWLGEVSYQLLVRRRRSLRTPCAQLTCASALQEAVKSTDPPALSPGTRRAGGSWPTSVV